MLFTSEENRETFKIFYEKHRNSSISTAEIYLEISTQTFSENWTKISAILSRSISLVINMLMKIPAAFQESILDRESLFSIFIKPMLTTVFSRSLKIRQNQEFRWQMS